MLSFQDLLLITCSLKGTGRGVCHVVVPSSSVVDNTQPEEDECLYVDPGFLDPGFLVGLWRLSLWVT